MFVPERMSVPGPSFVRPETPEIEPATFKEPATTVTVVVFAITTGPAPVVRLLEPRKVKSPNQSCGFTVVRVVAAEASSTTPS